METKQKQRVFLIKYLLTDDVTTRACASHPNSKKGMIHVARESSQERDKRDSYYNYYCSSRAGVRLLEALLWTALIET